MVLRSRRALSASLVNATGGMTTGPLSWGVTTFGTVTVDAAGLVTAVGQGTTGVYAVSTENGLADTAVISVQVPNRIEVMPTGATFFSSGENIQYTATLLDQGGNTVAPSRFSMGWGSYNNDVFTMDGGGHGG